MIEEESDYNLLELNLVCLKPCLIQTDWSPVWSDVPRTKHSLSEALLDPMSLTKLSLSKTLSDPISLTKRRLTEPQLSIVPN